MTVTAAAFADPTFIDRPTVPVRRIGALLARHLFLGTAAVATTGLALVSLALAVGWLVSPTLMHRHNGGTPADFRLRSMALAPTYPSADARLRLADVIVFPPTIADTAKPLHVAERAPPRRELAPVVKRPNVVPIPRAQPPELASLRSTQRVASLPPEPPSVLRVSPPAHAEKPPARTPDDHTAVYDISARSVYLPNGQTLEAHSGLGDFRDDPRSVRIRRRGVTPPNTYDLSLREHLFHGVRAIRLTPVDDDKMFGRDGMLAHTYMLGPDGDSNGCVSFKDYSVFLQAYLKGDIDRLVVVPGNGAALASRSRGNRDARYASTEPGPSSPRFSAAQ